MRLFSVRSFFALVVSVAMLGCSGPPRYPSRGAGEEAPIPGVQHQRAFFQGTAGAVLFEQSWRPEGAPAPTDKSTVVIVHGLKDHSSRYATLAIRLAKRGHPVYAFDLRGHAHSSGQRVGIDSFDEYLDDLSIFIDRVRAREGKDAKIDLFGHSMGGAIVTLWTIRKQPQLAGLITSGGALKVNVNGVTVGATKLTAAIAPQAPVFNLDLDDFSRDPAVVKEGKADGLVYKGGAPARTARELLGAIDEIEHSMEKVKVPLLALHGEKDKVTDPEGSKELVERASTKDKTLKIFPGLVHDLLHEPEKETVMSTIETWVDAH
jgi:alpha-beta hydrolase superfamily lysophospholipase